MNKLAKISVAAAVVLAVGALGASAYAHRHGGGHGMGHHGMGGHGMGGHGKGHHMKHMMKRYDANKDNKVTQDEINSNREAWLKEFDADKNGQLSLDEFKQLYLKAREQRIVREFQHFDADGSAGVTLEEYQEPLADMVARHDRNGDGALSREDHRGHGKGHHRMGRDGGDEPDQAGDSDGEPAKAESTNQ